MFIAFVFSLRSPGLSRWKLPIWLGAALAGAWMCQPSLAQTPPPSRTAKARPVPRASTKATVLQRLKTWVTRSYSPNPSQHFSHIQALTQRALSNRALRGAMQPLLRSPKWQVRQKATYALAHSASFLKHPKLLARLKALSRKDPHWRVREVALRAMGTVDSTRRKFVLPALLYSLQKDRYWQVRAQAAHSLQQLGEVTIQDDRLLIEALNDSAWQVRAAMASALRNVRPRRASWAKALGQRLMDPEAAVRYAASQTLARLGPPALPVLLHMAQSAHVEGRRQALQALSCHGKKSARAIAALRKGLRSKNLVIAQEATSALSQIGAHATPAIPELITLLQSTQTPLRLMASWALQKIGRASVQPLRQLLHDPSARIKKAAAETLGLIGPRSAKAAPSLVDTLLDKEWSVRSEAAWALYRLGPAGAKQIPMSMIPVLINSAQDKQWSVRYCIAYVLGWMGPRGRMIIGWFGPQPVSTVGVLQKLRATDPDTRVRRAATQALRRVLPPTP